MASPGDAVDLHAVWLPRSKLNSTAGSAAYRRGLVEAYMSVGNAMHDTAANLRGHVWTADPSLHALYRPVLGANGFEIEVPHSMIVHPKSKVTIHLRGGLETLVDGVEDASLRDDMRQLLENPACENIGFHSDVVRALVVLLYERQEVEGRALNVYADVDTLDDTTFLRDWRRTKPSESAPTAMSVEAARVGLLGMARTLGHPHVPTGSRQDIKVPRALHRAGFASNASQNDVICAAPGHDKARSVVHSMRAAADSLHYAKPPRLPEPPEDRVHPSAYELDMRAQINYFRELASVAPVGPNEPLDRHEALSHFVRAARVQSLRRAMQALVVASETGSREATDRTTHQRFVAEAAALAAVYNYHDGYIQNFVNLCAYSPQIGHGGPSTSKALDDFFHQIYGVIPRVFPGSSTWKGPLTLTYEAAEAYLPDLREHLWANEVILRLLRHQPPHEV